MGDDRQEGGREERWGSEIEEIFKKERNKVKNGRQVRIKEGRLRKEGGRIRDGRVKLKID